jgi:hypothetical protein
MEDLSSFFNSNSSHYHYPNHKHEQLGYFRDHTRLRKRDEKKEKEHEAVGLR